MKIHAEILNKKESCPPIRFDCRISPAELPAGLLDALSIKTMRDLRIKGAACRESDKSLPYLEYEITAVYEGLCTRCGEPYESAVSIRDKIFIAFTDPEELYNGNIDSETGDIADFCGGDGFYFAENGEIDLTAFTLEFFELGLPPASLCADNCKGLCSGCGANLNFEVCRCVKKSKNPAFDILEGLFDP